MVEESVSVQRVYQKGTRKSVSVQSVSQTWQLKFSISTKSVPEMVEGSQCQYIKWARHGRGESVSVQHVDQTW
ncbi:hypothetical protein DPMN_161800 [Dreissena polymorpha]|uniref:Uncharacterized protein n=1 Tax=Dreissena polymorpha TaxID=45954 RepID=A0A9D4EPH1_DREPO|nr:hypothetical protein DPMN_161800 [Dreissena polymorpha]